MTVEKPLRVGIAGYGVVGERRRIYIDRHPKLETIAVCDTKFTNSGQFNDGVHFFQDYEQLLEVPLDILFVSLPNYVASDVTIAGLKKGLHVFCEKPPGRDLEDIEKVIKFEKTVPRLCLKYGFNHRYHDSVREALKIINSKELGQVTFVRGVYGKSRVVPLSSNSSNIDSACEFNGWRAERKYAGGGILLDQGIHMLDLMRVFCGDFIEVKSYISNDYWGHDVEDNAFALMRDKHNRIAMLHSSATQWHHKFSLEVGLTEGILELQGILSGSKSYGEEKLIITKKSNLNNGSLESRTMRFLEDNSWKDEIDEFAEAIVSDKPIKHGTSNDALKTMQLVYMIYDADQEWTIKL